MPKTTPRGLDIWERFLKPLHEMHHDLHPDVMERFKRNDPGTPNFLAIAQDAIHLATKVFEAYRNLPARKDEPSCTESSSRKNSPTP